MSCHASALKKQLATRRFKNETPAHYEEDHFISLELAATRAIPRIYGRRCGAHQGRR